MQNGRKNRYRHPQKEQKIGASTTLFSTDGSHSKQVATVSFFWPIFVTRAPLKQPQSASKKQPLFNYFSDIKPFKQPPFHDEKLGVDGRKSVLFDKKNTTKKKSIYLHLTIKSCTFVNLYTQVDPWPKFAHVVCATATKRLTDYKTTS